MGMPDDKLNLAYVKALQYNVHHMVLLFISEPGAEPLILDNLIDGIAPASKRTDLMPIFSFNATGLWMAKQRGQGKMAGSSSRIKSWQDVLQKMAVNKF
jgi:predicted transglutaminase-like cysteine proteinase